MTALIYNHATSQRCIGKRKISSRSKKFINLGKLNFWKQTKEKLKVNIIEGFGGLIFVLLFIKRPKQCHLCITTSSKHSGDFREWDVI